MVAVLIAFPLLMLGTLIYVALAAHDETPIATSGAGQTGCVKCSERGESQSHVEKDSREVSDFSLENELIAA